MQESTQDVFGSKLLLAKLAIHAQAKRYLATDPKDPHAECNTLAYGPDVYPILSLVRACRRDELDVLEDFPSRGKRDRAGEGSGEDGDFEGPFENIQGPLYTSTSEYRWRLPVVSPDHGEIRSSEVENPRFSKARRGGADSNKSVDAVAGGAALASQDHGADAPLQTPTPMAESGPDWVKGLQGREKVRLEASVAPPIAREILHPTIGAVEAALGAARQEAEQKTQEFYDQQRKNETDDGNDAGIKDEVHRGGIPKGGAGAHPRFKRSPPRARSSASPGPGPAADKYHQNLTLFLGSLEEERRVLRAVRAARPSAWGFPSQAPEGASREEGGAVAEVPPSAWGPRMLALLSRKAVAPPAGEGEAQMAKERQHVSAYLKRVAWVEARRAGENGAAPEPWSTLMEGERVRAELASTMKRRAAFHRTRNKALDDENKDS